MLSPSQGSHVVVDRRFLPGGSAVMIPRTDDGRVLFAVPWHDHVVIGTTDTPVPDTSFEPRPLEEEIEFIMTTAARYLSPAPTRADVRSVYAGLRPLVKAAEGTDTKSLSRDHVIRISDGGLITLTGGKWTTYRVMAKDAIDEAASAMDGKVPQSCTDQIPLLGAVGYRAAWNKRGRIARAFGVHKHRIEHLLNRYGTLTD